MVKRIAHIGGFSYLNFDNRYGDEASCAGWFVQLWPRSTRTKHWRPETVAVTSQWRTSWKLQKRKHRLVSCMNSCSHLKKRCHHLKA